VLHTTQQAPPVGGQPAYRPREEESVTVELAKLVLEIVRLGMTAVVLVVIAQLIT
jgi:hypothetical protein